MIVEFRDNPEMEAWVRDFHQWSDAVALRAKQIRFEMAQQAQDDLNHGVDPLNVARMMWGYSQMLDFLDGLPELSRRAAKIVEDSSEDEDVSGGQTSEGQGGGCGG